MTSSRRIATALLAYVGWTAITLLLMRWLNPGEQSLLKSVSGGIGWNFVLAILFLLALIKVNRWSDLALVRPDAWRSLRLLWFPALYLVVFGGLAVAAGVSLTRAQVLFVLANVALVGVSEELMFRGVLFRALRSRLATWPAMLLTSVLFGGVHVLNVFTTGQLLDATVQALAATFTGLVMMALLLRTGSLWVPIVYHALFDLGLFLSGSSTESAPADAGLPTVLRIVIPLLLVLPNFLYALFLLRKVRNEAPVQD